MKAIELQTWERGLGPRPKGGLGKTSGNNYWYLVSIFTKVRVVSQDWPIVLLFKQMNTWKFLPFNWGNTKTYAPNRRFPLTSLLATFSVESKPIMVIALLINKVRKEPILSRADLSQSVSEHLTVLWIEQYTTYKQAGQSTIWLHSLEGYKGSKVVSGFVPHTGAFWL